MLKKGTDDKIPMPTPLPKLDEEGKIVFKPKIVNESLKHGSSKDPSNH
jgi:hypothetical protein